MLKHWLFWWETGGGSGGGDPGGGTGGGDPGNAPPFSRNPNVLPFEDLSGFDLDVRGERLSCVDG